MSLRSCNSDQLAFAMLSKAYVQSSHKPFEDNIDVPYLRLTSIHSIRDHHHIRVSKFPQIHHQSPNLDHPSSIQRSNSLKFHHGGAMESEYLDCEDGLARPRWLGLLLLDRRRRHRIFPSLRRYWCLSRRLISSLS
ncbi:hypothetical protein AKJ16_DCAP08481 [Drosera capensis]